ncbi:MAG: ATPase domain-containing protein [Candidatus Methanoperedens sp.]
MNIVPSYISNLDDILEGGFIKPSVVLVAGAAGSGKTTFAAQSLFNAARKGETCLFISTLSEPPAMINSYMSRFTFFDNKLYETNKMNIVSINESLLKQGHDAVLDFINKKISLLKPSRIVIDPLTVLGDILKSFEGRPVSDDERRGFYFDLFTSMKSWNTLVIITGEFMLDDLRRSVVGYLADGIIYISEETVGMRVERNLRVLKMRGQRYVSGKHSLDIRDAGIVVFPRLLPQAGDGKPASSVKVSTGIPGLDRMLKGGIPDDDIILISGTTGTGKTTFGLHFICDGLQKNENALIISMEERPPKLLRNSRTFGMNLQPYIDKKMLEVLYVSPVSYRPDEEALIIKTKIKENNVKRILFDGIENIETAIPDNIERKNYITVLLDLFSSMGVTTAVTSEISELFGAVKLTHEALSSAVDNIILLRHVEIEGKIHGVLSILKSRGIQHDKEIREFEITEKGIDVRDAMKGYESVLSGSARKTPVDVFKETFGEKR